MTTPYGFTVGHGWDDPDDAAANDLWRVTLPHQCDAWEITKGERYGEPVPHAQALADLRAFIAEAQEALRRLMAREVCGDDD